MERDILLLSCGIRLETFCLVSIAQILMVGLSSAAWFTSGEAWDSAFPSLLFTGLSGACKCCCRRQDGALPGKLIWGKHTWADSRQCNILAYVQPVKAVMLTLCSLKILFLAIFCISLARNL